MNSQADRLQESPMRQRWSPMSSQQVGRYAERLAHLEFSARGFEVFVPDVDDRSVDFVIRSASRRFIEVQVKPVRKQAMSSCESACFALMRICCCSRRFCGYSTTRHVSDPFERLADGTASSRIQQCDYGPRLKRAGVGPPSHSQGSRRAGGIPARSGPCAIDLKLLITTCYREQ
jgi:hypothetical protein